MITQRQRDVLTVARTRLGFADKEWHGFLRRWGSVEVAGDLDSATYTRLLDFLVVQGFRDPEYVELVSRDYCDAVYTWSIRYGLDEQFHCAVLAAADAVSGTAMSGESLHRIVAFYEKLGAPMEELRADLRRSILSAKQLALLHVALKESCITDSHYRLMLCDVGGGVYSASDLDEAGFRRMLVFFETKGFVPPGQRRPAKKPTFGRRPGMASPAQITLIRDLWREWSGADDEEAQRNASNSLPCSTGGGGRSGSTMPRGSPCSRARA